MVNEIATILGTQDYPMFNIAIAGIVFIFMIHSLISLLAVIFKFIGGIK